MISIDKLVEIGFTLPRATDIDEFLSNIGYIASYTTDDLVSGAVIPENKIITFSDLEGLKAYFLPTTQVYKDIEAAFLEKGNANPNKSRVNNVIVYQKVVGDANYGASVDAFITVNANYAQMLIDSRVDSDILSAAPKIKANGRLFVAQTSDADVSGKVASNIAELMKGLNNDSVLLTFHSDDTESLAAGLASIMAQPLLGSNGPTYSQITGVTPKEYNSTIMTNLNDQNVSYYSSINAISGGGVSQYATNLLYGGKQINGEDTKRRYIRFALNLLLKVKALDFLIKKLNYEESSNQILLSMLKSVLIEGQSNGLIVKDTLDSKGFELKALSINYLKTYENSLYTAQTYKIIGWYIDALTGRKVTIDLLVDPSDSEKGAFA